MTQYSTQFHTNATLKCHLYVLPLQIPPSTPNYLKKEPASLPVIVIQEPLEKTSLHLSSVHCLNSEEEAGDDETSSVGSVYSPCRSYHNLRLVRTCARRAMYVISYMILHVYRVRGDHRSHTYILDQNFHLNKAGKRYRHILSGDTLVLN